ncbi:MAG: hypothetical protein E6J42_12410 [Chloroflexi bacterium]|nr:MAG: hypothetical protein E6J42_12410 [Chloroflexota bacterium]
MRCTIRIMEGDVRYCTTADGVRIAYTVTGTGAPLVWVADILASHVQREWSLPVLREYYSAAASRRTLIRFDSRGSGLSDREIEDLSLEPRVRDLEAVADSLGLGEFALLGDDPISGWVVVTYAVLHPERVSHLILQDCCVSASDFTSVPSAETLTELLMRDWEMFTENVGSLQFGWAAPQAREFGQYIRTCVTEQTVKRSYAALFSVDVSSILPSVKAPTLVLGHTAVRTQPVSMSKDLAALIPDARVRVIEGGWGDNIRDAVDAIHEFLGEDASTPGPAVTESLLTAREAEVLSLLAGGYSGKEIAARLTVSLSTVQRHIANIYAKIDARGRVDAVSYAIKHGLVQQRGA